jgi:hypothetical protein
MCGNRIGVQVYIPADPATSITVRRIMRLLLTGLVAAFLLPAVVSAQTRSETTYYPDEIYPGENIVTITNAAGIERIRFRSTPGVKVIASTVLGCPTSVDVQIQVTNAVDEETVVFMVNDCHGGFGSSTLRSDNWTIRHHVIGPQPVGRDTCTTAEVTIGANSLGIRGAEGSEKIIDSMVSDDPMVRVVMPEKEDGMWRALDREPLYYRICYTPSRADTHTTQLRLYVKRRHPHKGMTNYLITKPVTVSSYVPPPPKEPEPDLSAVPGLPPLVDPTTFRNVVMPTAETLPQGRFFVGNFDVAGWLGGYGVTDDLMLMGGGAFIPEFIQKVTVGTIGAKYRALKIGLLEASVGAQYGYSSSETDISVFAPYGVISVGNRAYRISIAGGYSWKHHKSELTEFDENASIVTIGGDVTVRRGWKLAAETYFIEKSGLRPITVTSRWFGERLAFDLGLIVDLEGTSGVEGTGTLSGKIQEVRAAPLLSLVMVF